MNVTCKSILAALVAIVACHAAAKTIAAAEPAAAPVRWFAATSFWNTRLADDALIAPTSEKHVEFLVQQTKFTTTSSPLKGRHPPGENVRFSKEIAVWTVPAGQPTIEVCLVTIEEWMDVARLEEGHLNGLQKYLTKVPIPPLPAASSNSARSRKRTSLSFINPRATEVGSFACL